MALFGFRTRSPERDRETDMLRFQRLGQALGQIRAEMESERAGLQNRYESVAATAAFSQEMVEDDRVGADMSSRVEDLTRSMMRYSERLASLEKQIAFIREVEESAASFAGQITAGDLAPVEGQG